MSMFDDFTSGRMYHDLKPLYKTSENYYLSSRQTTLPYSALELHVRKDIERMGFRLDEEGIKAYWEAQLS